MKHSPSHLLLALSLALSLSGCTEGAAVFERSMLGIVMVLLVMGVTSFLSVFTIVALIVAIVMGPKIRSGDQPSIAPSILSLIAFVLGLLWLLLALGLLLDTYESFHMLALIPVPNLLLALFALVLSVRNRRRGLARQATRS